MLTLNKLPKFKKKQTYIQNQHGFFSLKKRNREYSEITFSDYSSDCID